MVEKHYPINNENVNPLYVFLSQNRSIIEIKAFITGEVKATLVY